MKKITSIATGILLVTTMSHAAPLFSNHDKQVDALLARMTLDEKIGQMVQVDSMALKDKARAQARAKNLEIFMIVAPFQLPEPTIVSLSAVVVSSSPPPPQAVIA